jgi:hypothetical protein
MLGPMDVCRRRRRPRDQRIDASGGPLTLTTPCGDEADGHLDGTITTTNPAREAPAGPVDVMAAAHNWLARTSSGGVVWPAPDGT